MVILNVQLQDLARLPFVKHMDVGRHKFLDHAFQYPEPVLGNPDDMIVALVDHMA